MFFTLYTSDASHWAYGAHLTLDEQGYDPSEYEVKQIGLVDGVMERISHLNTSKFSPDGTIPSLISAALQEPLVESADVLKYLDSNLSKGPSLLPENPKQHSKIEEPIAHVHQPQLSINLILLQARDVQELNPKKASFWNDFVDSRQDKLTKYGAAHLEIPLLDLIPEHERFFDDSHQGYKVFPAGLRELDSMLVMPYAAGERVTAADMHIVPCFAHALWAAGGETIYEFGPLEELIRKSVPDFEFGERTKV
ncbi:uncharacterized protein N7515_007375 [Penicillium bovifimosum]|uniref:GST N-terminal domain-containing protein n=1 Tax=Penicillium bovifimosum TaxID=126998 RepID=A0A9W9GXU8_9EURO|nr:uncharacterized protein N7515_007375 [Penicillium bovifimosum]KAJ5131336.1 hypothetical protein N7515_007375 [Penicillium bovifimosum]